MLKPAKEITILLGLAVGLAFTVNFLSPAGIALVGQWDMSQGVITANAKNDGIMDEMEIEDVKIARQIFDSGKALFVDARARETYDDGHIPGAASLPVGQFDEYIDSFMSEHSTDRPMVTYCSGRTCEDSHRLAVLLQEFGFLDVKVFIDGFPDWEAEGYPIE
jgi:rhodanese-related sulfurtransferase